MCSRPRRAHRRAVGELCSALRALTLVAEVLSPSTLLRQHHVAASATPRVQLAEAEDGELWLVRPECPWPSGVAAG